MERSIEQELRQKIYDEEQLLQVAVQIYSAELTKHSGYININNVITHAKELIDAVKKEVA